MKTKISANVDWMVVKKIDEYIHDSDMNRSEFIEQLFINFLIDKGLLSEVGEYKKEDL